MKKNSIIVIKFGGSIFTSEDNRKRFFSDLKRLINLGYSPIIVHGGGKQASSWLNKLGIASRFIKGLRYTDDKVLEIVEMVFSGKVNKRLTGEMNFARIKAVGLSGRDASLITARLKQEFGRVGAVKKVNTDFLKMLLKKKYVPVISSIASDGKKDALNVNADEMAYGIAVNMKAQRLIFMTDTKGVLENVEDENSLINTIHIKDVRSLVSKKIVQGGMLPKIYSARDAIKHGVKEVDIIDGRQKGVLMSLFKKGKISGTRIIPVCNTTGIRR